MNSRFTIDGRPELEVELADLCRKVLAGVKRILRNRSLEALVLGGGYGRGEGGVLRLEGRELPYNDLEFYLFLPGNRLLNEWKFRDSLHALGEDLSRGAGVHVEFKVDNRQRFRSSPVSMFSHDLVAGHKIIAGDERLFEGCNHHLRADSIPLSEATRLLFNRCTGLLLAHEQLHLRELGLEDRDFIQRNIAKAALALGDALLVVLGRYHSSCLERDQRLLALSQHDFAGLPSFEQVQQLHHTGVEFKLHPHLKNVLSKELEREYLVVSTAAQSVWLWIESRRLRKAFASPREYCEWSQAKCPERLGWENWLLNWRSFGWKAVLGREGARYPRERLLNTLPLLLWDPNSTRAENKRLLQTQLRTKATDWAGLVRAYKTAWPAYG